MRQFLPGHLEIAVDDLYDDLRFPEDAGAYVVLGMVASVDGAATLAGTSAALGGPADHAALVALRAHADVILAGAGTVRIEDYGPPSTSAARRAQRIARGQAPSPRLAIVSARLDLDPAARVFRDPQRRPIVVTTASADAERRAGLEAVADVVVVDGDDRVDLTAAIEHLAMGVGPRIVCEGGPEVAGQLLTAGIVREIFLTVAATVVGGSGPRMFSGTPEVARPVRLTGLHTDGVDVLLRYAVGGR